MVAIAFDAPAELPLLYARLRGRAQRPLWEPVDFSPALTASSLQRARALPCVAQLRVFFDEAGLPPKIGFNQGTGTVTFSLPLRPEPRPAHADPAAPPEDRAALSALALQLALAVHPQQRSAEEQWAALCAAERAGAAAPASPLSPETPAGEECSEPLGCANSCLRAFAEQTGVAITERRTSGAASLIVAFRLTSETAAPSRATFSVRQAAYKAVCYGPQYIRLAAGEALEEDMLAAFWSYADGRGYIPDPALRSSADGLLREWLQGGLRGLSAEFRPKLPALTLYMHGQSGIGKSEFVRTLSLGLERVLREYCDPQQRVAVVKVPLNATRADSLRQQTFVKGLSDHSIERIIEQTVCRGHIAVLHLEEMPDDAEAQAGLNELMMRCVQKLLGRYPQYPASVVTVCTSNHPCREPLAAAGAYRTVVHVDPPTEGSRRLWAARCLAGAMHEACGIRPEVRFDAFPAVPDMRQLQQWWLSLSHAGCALAADLGLPQGSAAELAVAADPAGEEGWILELKSDAGATRRVALSGGGSLFCCARGAEPGAAAGASAITAQRHGQLRVLAEMLAARRLRPAVLVLRGTEDACAAHAAAMEGYVLERCPATTTTALRIESEEDAVKVFGAPTEIRGGLFAFIDDATNPNSAGGAQLAAVTATVTETGQFILRELLEQGDKSRNHRLAVSKSGLLFTIILTEGSELTPQLASRAHLVIHCG
eukprot:TRINITY_DN55912_c0_g1_i1.p1 TRINITY_DN55912_c0_g1~~TRINITY_DN55912_c0_g1_i1.p1  ORF type:complete len:737 (+),score=209.74 TRINITY_DN55912_c0_g1_i1:74-2212(+)